MRKYKGVELLYGNIRRLQSVYHNTNGKKKLQKMERSVSMMGMNWTLISARTKVPTSWRMMPTVTGSLICCAKTLTVPWPSWRDTSVCSALLYEKHLFIICIAILFIDTFDNAWYNQVHWRIRTPSLSIIGSNDTILCKAELLLASTSKNLKCIHSIVVI